MSSAIAFESLLRVFTKVLYDDLSYYIIDYILKYEKAEEQKLANDLNLSYSQVRQSLYQMENHGILEQQEYRKTKEELEEKVINQYGINQKKNKTSEYRLSKGITNKIQHRFKDLKAKLEQDIKVNSNYLA